MEGWADIPGWSNYQASSEGRIRRKDTGRIVTQWRKSANKGRPYDVPYWSVSLTLPREGRIPGRKRNRSMHVHRLVCLAFRGEPPFGRWDAHHVDEDHDNNREGNIQWEASNSHRASTQPRPPGTRCVAPVL
jgi:hypothetical protein